MVKKLNIAFVCDSVNLQDSGSLISTWHFSVALAKKGHKVVLISTGEKNSFSVEEGVRIYRIGSWATPGTEGKWRMPIFPSKRYMKDVFTKEKIDLVHFTVPTPLCLRAANLAKKMGLPVVGHSHTQPENLTMYYRFDSELFKKYFYKFLLWFYSRAGVVVCPTKFSESKLKKYSKGVNTVVISNGVDLNRFKKVEITDEFIKKYDIKKGKKRILFVGRIWPDKNAAVLVKAMYLILKKNKNVYLDLVGAVSDQKYVDEVRALIEKYNLHDRVHLWGKVSDSDVVSFYNVCDVFCLPSYVELEGMVVLEAMGLEKPIVISDSVESASRFFVDGNGYNFHTADEVDLSKKMLKILGDDDLRKKMGEKSFENVKRLEMGECVKQLEDVYLDEIKKNKDARKGGGKEVKKKNSENIK